MKFNKFILFTFLCTSSVTYPMSWVAPKYADGLPIHIKEVSKEVLETFDKSTFGSDGIHKTIDNTNKVIADTTKTLNQTIRNGIEVVDKNIQRTVEKVHEAIHIMDKNVQTLKNEISKTNTEIANANKTFATLTTTFNNFLSQLDPPDRLAKTFGLGLMGLYVGKIGLQFLKVGIQKTIENNSNEHDKDTDNDKTIILTPERKKGLLMCACGLGFMSIGGYGMLHPGTIVNYFSH